MKNIEFVNSLSEDLTNSIGRLYDSVLTIISHVQPYSGIMMSSPQLSLRILFIFATKITIAPCIRIQSRPYESARSYPNTFFNSAFLAWPRFYIVF